MKKLAPPLLAALIGIPVIALNTATKRLVSMPFDVVQNWFSSPPTLGPEVRVMNPEDLPNGGFAISRTMTGTNFEILPRPSATYSV